VLLVQGIGFAQNKKLDSLKVELQKAKLDTTRLRIYRSITFAGDEKDKIKFWKLTIGLLDKLITETKEVKEKKKYLIQKASVHELQISYYFFKTKFNTKDTSIISDCIQKRLAIYQELKDTENIVSSFLIPSVYYEHQGYHKEALNLIQLGMSLSKKMNYKKGIAKLLQRIGSMYRNQGETKQALENFQQAVSILSEIKDTNNLIDVLTSIGSINRSSIEYYNKALVLCKVIKDKDRIVRLNESIGYIYLEHKDYANSLLCFQNSLAMCEELKDKSGSSRILNEIGNIYLQEGEIVKALENNYRALKLAEEDKKENPTSDDSNFADCFDGLARGYLKQKNNKKAKEFSDKAYEIKKKYQNLALVLEAEYLAFEVDSANGNFKDAVEHYKQSIVLRDKYKNQEVSKAAIKEKLQNEYDKQKAIDKATSDKEIEKQKIVRNSFIGGFTLMLLLAGVSYRNFRRKKKDNIIITNQKSLVEEKNREITDSISYALRIQTAILPPQKIVKQYLENSFILYKPKDIVAGDFYWMETVQLDNVPSSQLANETNQLILFAACDCTGHGVPGAMVSVVCHNALNRAVREFGLTEPAKILDKTAEIVVENFSKSEEDIKDGMDISLCAYNTKTKELQWAGANNPLWLLQKGELIETKADKQPIGMNENSKPFTNHTFNLNATDTIYLFTDGFADQFGGETGEKKLTKKRFKDLILSIQGKTMPEQGIALDKFITEYRKEVEQIDDILVMGVRV